MVEETISYKRYWGTLFQKAASVYLLHFVQDGSSKNVHIKCTHMLNFRKFDKITPPLLAPLKGPISPGTQVPLLEEQARGSYVGDEAGVWAKLRQHDPFKSSCCESPSTDSEQKTWVFATSSL